MPATFEQSKLVLPVAMVAIAIAAATATTLRLVVAIAMAAATATTFLRAPPEQRSRLACSPRGLPDQRMGGGWRRSPRAPPEQRSRLACSPRSLPDHRIGSIVVPATFVQSKLVLRGFVL